MIRSHIRRAGLCRGMLAAFLALAGSQTSGEAKKPAATTLPCDRYIALRAGLPNCRVRFAHEKKGRVAFLGGSITWADNGWRSMVCEDLRKRFPQTSFDFINAGIPSTDTALAPFRLDDTVFMRGRVDLLFVEFAVNDETNGRTATDSIRGMEGVVRKTRASNPAIDIVIMYFVEPAKMEAYRKGKTPTVIVSHDKVAAHYGIPSIDLAREVTERIDAGEFTWADFRDLHPSPFGHGIYARSIDRLFELAWGAPLPADAKVRLHRMPDRPVDPFNYGRGRFVDPKHAEIVSGWRMDPSWKPKQGDTREGFVNVPMLVADEPGATLKLTFEGTAIGLLVAAGYDVGIVEFSIDGGSPKRLDQFTQWSGGLHIPWAYILDAELKPGRHELTLQTTDQKNAASRGVAVRILRFLVN
jgi:sialidase-1